MKVTGLIMALALSTLLTVLDSIAKGVEIFEAAVGVLGTEANTVAKGASNNIDTLKAIADETVQNDLIPSFVTRKALVLAGAVDPALRGPLLQGALDHHYGDSHGSLNRMLAANNARVHPLVRNIGFQIDAANAFMPTVLDPVITFAVTGAGAGTATPGADIDATKYGVAHMKARTTSVIGVASITATFTMKRADGQTEDRAVVIPNGTASGIEFDIGAVTDRYMGVLAIAITGGTAGDAFKVISTVERTIVL